jgi:hypothetical protein
MGKFNLMMTPQKRIAQDHQPSSAAQLMKLPRVADLTMMEQGPRLQQARRLAETGPVLVTIYKVTDEASDIWSSLEGTGCALFQFQIKHEARPSTTYNITKVFNDFLKKIHADDESVPTTLKELQKAGIKLTLTDAQDPENVGFQNWRVAFYVACAPDALRNFLLLLDSFWLYKAKQMMIEEPRMKEPFVVSLHPHTGIDISEVLGDLEYDHYSLEEASDDLPMKFFEAQGAWSKKVVTLHLEADNDEELSIMIAGPLYGYRNRFESHGIAGAYYSEGDTEARSYYRVLKNLNISDDTQTQKVMEMLGDAVFKGLALRVVVDKAPGEGTSVEKFLNELKACSQLHFSS